MFLAVKSKIDGPMRTRMGRSSIIELEEVMGRIVTGEVMGRAIEEITTSTTIGESTVRGKAEEVTASRVIGGIMAQVMIERAMGNKVIEEITARETTEAAIVNRVIGEIMILWTVEEVMARRGIGETIARGMIEEVIVSRPMEESTVRGAVRGAARGAARGMIEVVIARRATEEGTASKARKSTTRGAIEADTASRAIWGNIASRLIGMITPSKLVGEILVNREVGEITANRSTGEAMVNSPAEEEIRLKTTNNGQHLEQKGVVQEMPAEAKIPDKRTRGMETVFRVVGLQEVGQVAEVEGMIILGEGEVETVTGSPIRIPSIVNQRLEWYTSTSVLKGTQQGNMAGKKSLVRLSSSWIPILFCSFSSPYPLFMYSG